MYYVSRVCHLCVTCVSRVCHTIVPYLSFHTLCQYYMYNESGMCVYMQGGYMIVRICVCLELQCMRGSCIFKFHTRFPQQPRIRRCTQCTEIRDQQDPGCRPGNYSGPTKEQWRLTDEFK